MKRQKVKGYGNSNKKVSFIPKKDETKLIKNLENILNCNLDTVLKILEALECNKTEIKDFFFALEQDILSYLGFD